ncbi:MAG: GTPase Era [Gammaproteobacteria bacterium]|nr:GTPase Era [Gammaproteobacteria bacterium]
MKKKTYCGYVAIIGKPNVGKSTLLNRLIGRKISITSKKPQTTRYQILGIKTQHNKQIIFVDTPGIHPTQKRQLDRLMNRAATSIIADVDLIIFMVDAKFWSAEDEFILSLIQKNRDIKKPVILVLNKVDLVKNKKQLLPKIKMLSEKQNFVAIIPLSLKKEVNIDALEKIIDQNIPAGNFLFPKEQFTDRDDRFLTAEIIREKIMRVTGQEVPYDIAVIIESFRYEENLLKIDAVIWVSKPGQKKIMIGTKGEKLKEIGTQARLDLEKLFNTKVFLSLWVKIKTKWSDDSRLLTELGF